MIYLPCQSRRHVDPQSICRSTQRGSISVQSVAGVYKLGKERSADIGGFPDAGMFEEALLALRGRIAYRAGVVAVAQILHLDRSLLATSLLINVPPLICVPAPEVAEESREPLSQQRAQSRQVGRHDGEARLDGVQGRAPCAFEAAILRLVKRLGEHANPDDSDDCDSVTWAGKSVAASLQVESGVLTNRWS